MKINNTNTKMKKHIRIEQVDNGFVVFTRFYHDDRYGECAMNEDRYVFQTHKQLNKFLNQYFVFE